MVRDHTQELLILVNPDTRVFRSVTACDLWGGIRAAVIDYRAIPVLIGLPQDAFDALREMLGAVVHRSNNAYQWLRCSKSHFGRLGRSQCILLDRRALPQPSNEFHVERLLSHHVQEHSKIDADKKSNA